MSTLSYVQKRRAAIVPKARTAALVVCAAYLAFAALSAAATAIGLRVNTTRSIPLGLYLRTDEPVKKGDYVIFCPPAGPVFDEARRRGYLTAGPCPGDYGYLMKRVLAAKGDLVAITASGVEINGTPVPNSKPLLADKSGRPLPDATGATVLRGGELLLMSDTNPASFDGRYFGPVARSHIEGVIRPLFTW